jgi:cell division protein FtsQ
LPRVVRPPQSTRQQARGPRNSVNDRPSRLKLLLRRQRRLLRPAAYIVVAAILVVPVLAAFHSGAPNSVLGGLRDRIAHSAAVAGMSVTDIVIEGRANTPEPLLRTAIGVSKGDPTLGFSVAAARARIESLAWVQHATVERRLPGTIVVALEERRPFAIWQHEGKFKLIDRTGEIVTDQDASLFKNLPLVVGVGAPKTAAVLLDALRDRPAIASRVAAAVRVGERRWNLHLNSGCDVLLPEGHEIEALDRLIQLEQQHALLDRPLQTVDMRLPDRLVVHPQPSTDSKPDVQQRRPT